MKCLDMSNADIVNKHRVNNEEYLQGVSIATAATNPSILLKEIRKPFHWYEVLILSILIVNTLSYYILDYFILNIAGCVIFILAQVAMWRKHVARMHRKIMWMLIMQVKTLMLICASIVII